MANKQFRVKSVIARVPVVPGSFALVDIPRQYDSESISFRLTGQIQVTAAATAVRAEAPTQLIQRVDIVSDGRNQICSAPYWALVFGAFDRINKQGVGARNTLAPSSTAIGTYNIEALGVYDYCLPDGERAKDSNFPTQNLSLYQFRLTFGNASDCFVNGTANLINCFVEVTYTEMVEIPDSDGKRTMPFFMKKMSFQEYAPGGNNGNYEIRIPAGNLIKNALIRTEGSPSGGFTGEPTTLAIRNVIARAGQDVRLNITGDSLRSENSMIVGNILPGYYFHDFTRAANNASRMTELWDVTRQAEPKLIFDVQAIATTKIGVVITEMLAYS